jgi:hypothetical protein
MRLSDSPADLAARLQALGLPLEVPISMHENGRVMVTMDPARGLRLHRGYAYAPDEVLAAIVRWARPLQTRRERRAAARVMLGFGVHDHVPRPSPRRRTAEPAEPGDDHRLSRLSALHAAVNQRWFQGRLRPIEIRLSSRMRRKLGHYEPASEGVPAISISRRHLRRDGWPAVEQTLRHEMVHQWQDEAGLPVDHGAEFRRKARAVGIEPRAIVRTR